MFISTSSINGILSNYKPFVFNGGYLQSNIEGFVFRCNTSNSKVQVFDIWGQLSMFLCNIYSSWSSVHCWLSIQNPIFFQAYHRPDFYYNKKLQVEMSNRTVLFCHLDIKFIDISSLSKIEPFSVLANFCDSCFCIQRKHVLFLKSCNRILYQKCFRFCIFINKCDVT